MNISPLEMETIEDSYTMSSTGDGGEYGHGSNLANIAIMSKAVSDEIGMTAEEAATFVNNLLVSFKLEDLKKLPPGSYGSAIEAELNSRTQSKT